MIEKNSQKFENFDPDEIKKFEELADSWWDPKGSFKPLHHINPLRLNFIDARAELADKKVLDVGCGGGILSESMSVRGALVTGIDMGEAPLSVAKLHAKKSNLDICYKKVSVEELSYEQAEQYDVITCLEMLEHVPDPSSIVKACENLVKPGGHVFFSTINRTAKSFLFAIVGAEYILKILPKGTHNYKKFIKPSELEKWIRGCQLETQEIIGMTYNPIIKVYKLNSDDIQVNYLVHVKKT